MATFTSVSLPGVHTPAVGFEQPFEMLSACHERVQRTLDLLARLQEHLVQHGCDGDARQAAADVLRYFDMAAPLHHEDEELHVFPPLLADGNAEVRAVVRTLQQDHRLMELRWAEARAVLQAVLHGTPDTWTPLNPRQSAALHDFAALYADHIASEELIVYPVAQARLAPQAQQAMGADMMRRRGHRGG